ncbi:transcriptional regulator [Enterococcus faecalis]|uniref:helix-turn-helix domain-containing protein n=1 Tax=Enterococcus TaxID=1350 RepID=UPI00035411AC|nr:helix-turn-helix domain-containing protein [Enterococcus faecalis]EGO2576820.1 transcriptional regulator [Enterococcus faecalis]EGO8587396.1 transcriptional regulator [Enterococcus faecalis]EPH79382.1 M protein trans-acting positive regulator HTH domain protein [Enterococcus faecalis 02-MB-BW-10]KAJ64403.1 hypothetical protein P787_2244 [Enterococcus faecalis MN16]MDN3067986.1 helix-turn-helix domain-containing protein [Enterococcus faecalis]
MIEKYIEKDILRQVKLIDYLIEAKSIPVEDLCRILNITFNTLKNDMKKIQEYLPKDSCSYSLKNKIVSINFTKKIDRYEINRKIYSQSQFLKTCDKYIHNKTNYLTIVEEEFISVTQAFRLKKRVLEYLKEIDLYIEKEGFNYKNELNWRNFIISVWVRIGIPSNILNTKKYKESSLFVYELEQHFKCSLENMKRTVLLIVVYLMITRSKKNKLLFPTEIELAKVKSAFFYKEVKKLSIRVLPSFSLSSYEIGYLSIYLRVISLNQSKYNFLLEDYEYIMYTLLNQHTELQPLIHNFENTFNINLQNNIIFNKALSNLVFSTWLNIQTQFVEKHYYLSPKQLLYKKEVQSILYNWSKFYYPIVFNDLAIDRFCSLTYSLLSTSTHKEFFIMIVAEDELSHILYRESLLKWLNNSKVHIDENLYYSLDSINFNTKFWTPLIICERVLFSKNSKKIMFPVSRNSIAKDLQRVLSFLYENC